ncbi:hypothetical protein AN944_02411 [Shewanella sp. P1-14-1]|uniref:hypothetical protein n=1 Tax=Shewanella sp. P1-14-1 TaxID=1723761 RepID=UPI0006D6831A|nr:hypothetical protein [Shewanella sp. P1-14-1]KPZ70339.1 hypothetical protein AN944_02411 [Shewanella sp. P1-14-1]
MNLFNSILTSVLIVILVWGAALFQSPDANALIQASPQPNKSITSNTIEPTSVDSNSTPAIKVNQQINIAGIRQNIAIADIHQLWQTFNDQAELHASLVVQPTKVFVLYSAMTNSFERADVTIGYDVKELKQHPNTYSIDTKNGDIILPEHPYTAAQLATAWEKIDYSKTVNFVLETHFLDNSGNATSTTMLVSYQ